MGTAKSFGYAVSGYSGQIELAYACKALSIDGGWQSLIEANQNEF
jgi:hypothetical protein